MTAKKKYDSDSTKSFKMHHEHDMMVDK